MVGLLFFFVFFSSLFCSPCLRHRWLVPGFLIGLLPPLALSSFNPFFSIRLFFSEVKPRSSPSEFCSSLRIPLLSETFSLNARFPCLYHRPVPRALSAPLFTTSRVRRLPAVLPRSFQKVSAGIRADPSPPENRFFFVGGCFLTFRVFPLTSSLSSCGKLPVLHSSLAFPPFTAPRENSPLSDPAFFLPPVECTYSP